MCLSGSCVSEQVSVHVCARVWVGMDTNQCEHPVLCEHVYISVNMSVCACVCISVSGHEGKHLYVYLGAHGWYPCPVGAAGQSRLEFCWNPTNHSPPAHPGGLRRAIQPLGQAGISGCMETETKSGLCPWQVQTFNGESWQGVCSQGLALELQ